MLVAFICPMCAVSHGIEMEEWEEYDGLCLDCEETWIESAGYKLALAALNR